MNEKQADAQPQPRKSYRQGEALKDALAALNRAGARPSVRLDRKDGWTDWSVYVPADSPQEAYDEAVRIADVLDEKYPAPPEQTPDPHKITLTRNAKGETQIAVEGRGDVHEHYETLRARYPLNDGTVSADKPKAAK